MNIRLSESIRAFRKARSLTQEQLAEALGVSVGAVYKWEAGLSTPDIELIVELADLFDTSVDVLLGYEMKSNKQAATVERLRECIHGRDKSGLAEAEKALLRYPNSFDVVHWSARLYYLFGFTADDKTLIRRAIELLERAIPLLGQNTDPAISEISLYSDIAGAYLALDDTEKALDILKKNNPLGVNDDVIGITLAAVCKKPDEGAAHLSVALVSRLTSLVRIVIGYVNVYAAKKDWASGEALLRLALDFFGGFKKDGKSNLLDKACTNLYVFLALFTLKRGLADEARQALQSAKALAEAFDEAPDYSADNVRYVFASKRQTAYDNLGETAIESVRRAVREADSEALARLWEELEHED